MSKKNKKIKAVEDVSPPNEIYMGYYSGAVKKKDLVEYLKNKAFEHVTPIENACYAYKRHGDGYLWEIHDGGSGFGICNFVSGDLDDKGNCVFGLADNIYIAKSNDVTGNVSFIKATSTSILAKNADVKTPIYSGKMKNFISNGFGFFVFSLILIALSLVSLFLSFYFSSVGEHRITTDSLYKSTSSLPVTMYQEIESYKNNEESGIYVKQMTYHKTKGKWLVDSEPTVDYENIKDDVIKRLGKNIEEPELPESSLKKTKGELAAGRLFSPAEALARNANLEKNNGT